MESIVKESEEFTGSNKGSNPKSRFMNLEGGLFYISEKKMMMIILMARNT